MKDKLDLVVIPYHDWRKIQAEGSRTRDAHFIESFRANVAVNKLIIINRPISHLELLVKKRAHNIKGKIILKKNGFKLIRIDSKTYLIDFVSKKSISHAFKRRRWYFEEYENVHFVNFINQCLQKLSIVSYNLLSQNIYASGTCRQLEAKHIIFDAWDNFCLIPAVKRISKEIFQSYQLYEKIAQNWFTNSLENIAYYKKEFNVEGSILLKNGVDVSRFVVNLKPPNDILTIPKPIIGFGGKVTHLFDSKLYKYLIVNNPDKSFVLVGQILDKGIFAEIGEHDNFYYLGDKHYDNYPSYVKHFDIAIVPYVINNKQHGGDSMKAYEYLAANKPVIGTRGNGLEDLEKHIQLADSREEFSYYLSNAIKKEPFPSHKHTWNGKSNIILHTFFCMRNQ